MKIEYRNMQILAKRNNGRKIHWETYLGRMQSFPNSTTETISKMQLTELMEKMYQGGGTLEVWIWNARHINGGTPYYEPEIKYEWYFGDIRTPSDLLPHAVKSIWAKIPNNFKEQSK